MKNLFLALAFMLVGTFAFANNGGEISTVSYDEAVELVSASTSYEVVDNNSFVDCLLEITFVFEDGTSETFYVLVIGASCDEILN